MIAEAFGVNLVLAKNTKEVGIPDFIEESYIPSNSAVRMVLYIPKKSLKRGDSVLIVDDVIRSGETQKALMNIVGKARAEVAGIYALVGVGENWREKIPTPSNVPCEVVLTLPSSSS
jgi:adenine phosphoribosyltransferase